VPVINAYGVLKFLHVLSYCLGRWNHRLTVVTWRVARERDRAALAVILRHSSTFAQHMVDLHPGSFFSRAWRWSAWDTSDSARSGLVGYAGIALHGFIGGLFLRKRVAELTQLIPGHPGNDAALLAAARDSGRRSWFTF